MTIRRILMPALVALAAVVLAPAAPAADIPFPAAHTGPVFVIAQTVAADGTMHNSFAPGSSVTIRAYAVDGKTDKVLVGKDVTYFYATVPNQPNVKLRYDPKARGANGQYTWTGTWTVPSTYPSGVVNLKVLVKAKSKRTGSFVQVPVPTSQLTIAASPLAAPGTGPTAAATTPSGKVDAVVYADSVNGTRPAAAAPRPVGCTQTNVFKRGEQFVLRTWGFNMADGSILSIDNVTEAHFTVPGVANVALNWGSHGPQRVFFWTNAWQIPASYPLGDMNVRIAYTLTSGKTATLDYPITIIP